MLHRHTAGRIDRLAGQAIANEKWFIALFNKLKLLGTKPAYMHHICKIVCIQELKSKPTRTMTFVLFYFFFLKLDVQNFSSVLQSMNECVSSDKILLWWWLLLLYMRAHNQKQTRPVTIRNRIVKEWFTTRFYDYVKRTATLNWIHLYVEMNTETTAPETIIEKKRKQQRAATNNNDKQCLAFSADEGFKMMEI